jgi:hypothetical protein
VGRLMGRAR